MEEQARRSTAPVEQPEAELEAKRDGSIIPSDSSRNVELMTAIASPSGEYRAEEHPSNRDTGRMTRRPSSGAFPRSRSAVRRGCATIPAHPGFGNRVKLEEGRVRPLVDRGRLVRDEQPAPVRGPIERLPRPGTIQDDVLTATIDRGDHQLGCRFDGMSKGRRVPPQRAAVREPSRVGRPGKQLAAVRGDSAGSDRPPSDRGEG